MNRSMIADNRILDIFAANDYQMYRTRNNVDRNLSSPERECLGYMFNVIGIDHQRSDTALCIITTAFKSYLEGNRTNANELQDKYHGIDNQENWLEPLSAIMDVKFSVFTSRSVLDHVNHIKEKVKTLSKHYYGGYLRVHALRSLQTKQIGTSSADNTIAKLMELTDLV